VIGGSISVWALKQLHKASRFDGQAGSSRRSEMLPPTKSYWLTNLKQVLPFA
jgi:hypothetical protein